MYKRLVSWFEHIGRYRAATELARQGYHKETKHLMWQGDCLSSSEFLQSF